MYRIFLDDEDIDLLEKAGYTLLPFEVDAEAYSPEEKLRLLNILKRVE